MVSIQGHFPQKNVFKENKVPFLSLQKILLLKETLYQMNRILWSYQWKHTKPINFISKGVIIYLKSYI